MSKNEKLKARFLTMPSDFHYNELVKFLRTYGFKEEAMGRTSGSRVRFINSAGIKIILHKPHPSGILKHYQMKQIKDFLGL